MDARDIARRVPPGLLPGKSEAELGEMLQSDLPVTVDYVGPDGQPVHLAGTVAEIVAMLLPADKLSAI